MKVTKDGLEAMLHKNTPFAETRGGGKKVVLGFEPRMKVLQTCALPLGYTTAYRDIVIYMPLH